MTLSDPAIVGSNEPAPANLRYRFSVLERVTLGQTRFAMPGVATDSRGIVLGKLGVLLFPSLDGVVAWLRLYSDEDSLDDLLPGTQILRLRTALASRALGLVIPAASSYILDRAARCARLAGGAAYTGTSRHFVKYRDEASPYGYDVVDLGSHGAGADWVLHAEEGTQAYQREGELAPADLIFRLSPRRVPGAERLDAEARERLFVAVAPGLAAGLQRYLLRNRVEAEATEISLGRRSAFAAPGEPEAYRLLSVRDLPPRLLEGLRGVPGVAVFKPVAETVAVEVGWEHPVTLSSCASLFQRDKFSLFWGEDDRLDVITGPLAFARVEHLQPLRVPSAPRIREGRAEPPAASMGVEVRLVPTLSPPRRVTGTLLAWREAPLLKRLVYTLPPAMLRGHRVALTDRGLLLLSTEGVDLVPLGTLLCEVAPGLLIPLGMDLVPRVATEVLAEAIQHQLGTAAGPREAKAGTEREGRLTVFPVDGFPFFVAQAALQPLERRTLAGLTLPEAVAQPAAVDAPAAQARVVNDPVGRFALWGFDAREKE